MKFAACIGACGLPNFTEFGIKMLRNAFGQDIPIVVRDDYSIDSQRIEEIAGENNCYYRISETPLGHFGGDVQAFIDALALAEHEQAEVAIKVSQRLIVAHPSLRPVMEKVFQDPNVWVSLPGRPDPMRIRHGHHQFAKFPCLTDVAFMRVGKITPDFIKKEYEEQIKTSTHYVHVFVELFWDRLRTQPLKDHVYLCPQLTEHVDGMPPLYLRRYQNRPEEYAVRAAQLGIGGSWDLSERGKINRHYDPRPKFMASA